MKPYDSLRQLTKADIPAALKLINAQHDHEASHHQGFPSFLDFESPLKERLKRLVHESSVWGIFSGQCLVGFMGGIGIGPLFGRDPGVVIPAYAWSVEGSQRIERIITLLTQVMHDWVERSHTSVAWTIMAHDRSALKVARQMGFGNRCADAIRNVDHPITHSHSYRIERLEPASLEQIAILHQAHNRYYRNPPLWMPNPEEDPLKDLRTWMADDDHRIYAAWDDSSVMGYLRVQPHAESYVSHHPKLRNITAAYVDPSARHHGIASALLASAIHDMKRAGVKWCGVDYETINPSGSAFWEKHFDAYTFSLTRRIDERIVTLLNQLHRE